MGSTATSHCWRGRSTSIISNLPLAESSEDMFDFVFGDQNFPSNISSRESVAVVSSLRCEGVCEVERGGVVCKPEFPSTECSTSRVSVSSSLPHTESVAPRINTVVAKHQNDISIFATPLPEFVLEQRQRKLSKDSNGSTPSAQPTPPCTIIEEGREWYGYRDEGIRQAAEIFGVTGPWIRPSSGTEDVYADRSEGTGEEGKGGGKKEKPFWHGNGRKVGVEERWMCVGDDEFGIVDELVVVDEGAEEGSVDSGESVGSDGSVDGDDSTLVGGQDSGERPWWSVRWKNVFMMLGCGVLA